METKKITAKDVLLIQALAGEHKYAQGTKMEGQTYRRFVYEGKVFTSNDPKFFEAVDNGNLDTVTLGVDESGQFSLTGFITLKQALNYAKGRAALVAVEAIKPEAMTAELLEALVG